MSDIDNDDVQAIELYSASMLLHPIDNLYSYPSVSQPVRHTSASSSQLPPSSVCLRSQLIRLQAAAMDDLVVNSQFLALIVNDKNANTATAIIEAVGQPAEEVALVEHLQALLDIAGLGHGDDTTIITDVQHAVLLEDWAEHVLDDDGGRWVADEAALLVQLLGEEVNAEVAVLAGLGGGGDADDLARAALQDEEIPDADVVAWDGDGVWWSGRGTRGAASAGVTWRAHVDFAVFNDNFFLTVDAFVGLVVVVVMLVTLLWAVDDAIGGAVETVTEAVVVAVLVVISHINAVLTLARCVDGTLFADTYCLVEVYWLTLGDAGLWEVSWLGALVLPATCLAVVIRGVRCRCGALAVVLLSYVDASVEVNLGSGGMTGVELSAFAVVGAVLNVDLGV